MVHHAQCSYYNALLNAGVKIFLYPAPYVLHSKHFSVDDDVAVIGSSNMDIRSFNLDFEGLGDVCKPLADDGYARLGGFRARYTSSHTINA
jgi:hypothetical protein